LGNPFFEAALFNAIDLQIPKAIMLWILSKAQEAIIDDAIPLEFPYP
jgi:hypothetical protein